MSVNGKKAGRNMIFITGGEGAGQAEYAEKHYPGAVILGSYHLTVKAQMNAGEDPLQKAALLLREHEASGRNLVIWTCEIGCGLVPVAREERASQQNKHRQTGTARHERRNQNGD